MYYPLKTRKNVVHRDRCVRLYKKFIMGSFDIKKAMLWLILYFAYWSVKYYAYSNTF